MNNDIINSIEEQSSLSIQKIGKWFSDFFQKYPENKILVDNLFSWLIGLACGQKQKNITNQAKIARHSLKNEINPTTIS